MEELLAFMRRTIEGREYAKFVFTKSISEVMDILLSLGECLSLSREDLAFLDIKNVLGLYSDLCSSDLSQLWLADIEKNKREYEITKSIRLPALIVDARDIYDFSMGKVEANYITSLRVLAPLLREEELASGDPSGKIVIIERADPGYDWLFAREIAGLVTLYGGANSHMAIRCAELGIPAIIGCGEANYSAWSEAGILEIDCAARKVTVVR